MSAPVATPPAASPSGSRRIFESRSLRFGSFVARPEDPGFAESGQPTHHLIVFPRRSVCIEREDAAPFVADSTCVTLYNLGDRYRRRAVSPAGDACEWLAVAPHLLVELVATFDPTAVDRVDRPFPVPRIAVDAAALAVQRTALRQLASGEAEPVYLEETLLGVARTVVRSLFGGAVASPPSAGVAAAARHVAECVARLAEERLDDCLSLQRIADEVGCSPFHLCRLFKQATGSTLHAWLLQVRLRRSLELIAESTADLTSVALDLGFASHSHFTNAFRRTFGMPPSTFRRTANGRSIRALATRAPSALS